MSRGRRPPRQVFLSHSHRDLRFVERLARALRDAGIRTWYSEHRIVGAQQWHDEIGNALRRSDWLILVLSPSGVRSKWVKRELLYALQEDRYEERIVPLLYKQCDPSKLSWTLASFQRVEFTRGFEAGCRELLRTWGIHR